jgi:type VI secretion system protein ImpA
MPVNSELLARLLAPVAEDAPAGQDLRYDPRYDQVKEARREDPDLPPGELDGPRKLADWPKTVALASQLLASETKDLQLAAWLTEALLRTGGFAGLTTGLAVLEGFLRSFWDGLHPAIDEDDLELRAGPIEWVGSRLDVAVRQVVVLPGNLSVLDILLARGVPTEAEADSNADKRKARADAEAAGRRLPEAVDAAFDGASKAYLRSTLADIDAATQGVASLEQISDERFGRDAPGFTALRKALEEAHQLMRGLVARKLEIDPDPADEIGDASGGGESEGEARSGDGTIPSEVTSARDAATRIAAAARFLRTEQPSNPAPFLLLRGYRWGELRATPGELDPRLLEAPPTAVRSRLKALLLDGRWSELLEQGEQLMATPQGRGWLDLQRYTLTACAQLGDSYDAVAAVVRSELRALLAALPQLPNMTLMDDTPTANGETHEWLEREGLVPDPASPDADTPAAAALSDQQAGDTVPDDGTEALEDALADDDATSANGGLARAPMRRPRVRSGSDPFTLARQELALGRPNRAIELMVAQLAREHSPRARFVRQTQVAWLMVEAGLAPVARPILERLVQVVDERSLEEWEAGPLVAQPMALLHRVYETLDVREDDRDELYLRICRLDALQALGLRQG